MKTLFFLGSIAMTFLTCSGGGLETTTDYRSVEVVEEQEAAGVTFNQAEVYQDYNDSSEDNAVQQKIIRDAYLSFETSDLEKTTTRIYDAVKKYNAQIQRDNEGKDYQSIYYRNITIRVHNQNFERLVEEISQDIAFFDTKEITSQDVTEQYIDIKARLKGQKELEVRYLELLKKANKVSEMIEIEKELSRIRQEIEVKEGQLNFLQNRVTMSSIRVYFYKKTTDNNVISSYGSKMWNAIKSGFNGISSFFIWILEIWHVLFLLGICYFYFTYRYSKKKKKAKNELKIES